MIVYIESLCKLVSRSEYLNRLSFLEIILLYSPFRVGVSDRLSGLVMGVQAEIAELTNPAERDLVMLLLII